MKLVIDFTCSKTNLNRMEDEIMRAVQDAGISVDTNSFEQKPMGQPVKQNVPIRNRTIQEWVQRVEYRFEITPSVPSKETLDALKKKLSNIEVHSVKVE